MKQDSLREKIKKLLMIDMSEQDADKAVEIFLSLFREAVEEAKPKEKRRNPTGLRTDMVFDDIEDAREEGYNQALFDYHEALMEVLK